jgi:N-terminal domain of anti-restriction factor ArdC
LFLEMLMSVYQSVLASLIAAIERGADRYEMPWHAAPGRAVLPVNASTGLAYQGLNILILWGILDKRGYSTNLWATYKQWAALGAQVRRGERATPCVKWKELPSDGDEERRLLPLGFSLSSTPIRSTASRHRTSSPASILSNPTLLPMPSWRALASRSTTPAIRPSTGPRPTTL